MWCLATMAGVEVFPFAFDARFSWLLRPLGVTPGNAMVTVGDDGIDVRFGRWHLATPLANLDCVEVTRGYRWWKAVGVRGSLVDHGITFGTNRDTGVCVRFVDPVPALLPTDRYRHPAMTVTVADPEGLVVALAGRGVHA